MNNSRQIKYGAIISYLSIALNLIAGLVYTPWMIKHIGQSHYGLYTLATSLITLFLIDFGLSSATSRYLSTFHAEGNEEKASKYLGAIYKLYLAISAVILVALIVVYFLLGAIYTKLTPDELSQFRMIYIISASFSIINFPFITQNGILTAYEKFIPLKLADIIYRLLIVIITAISLILGGGLYALVTVHAIVGLIVIAYKFVAIRKFVPLRADFSKTDKTVYKDIFSFSSWVMIATLAQRLVFNITPTILGITTGSAAIAVFGIVTTIESNTFMVTGAINGLFMPKISRIYAGNDNDSDIMPLMINVGRFQFALMSLIVVVFGLIGKEFILLWMGEDYIEAYIGILLVIIPGLIFNSLQIANTALTVKNKVKTQAVISIIVGGVNIVLSLIFSTLFGVIGSCLSIFVAYTIRNIAYLIAHRKYTGVNIFQFIRKCYLRLLIPLIIALVTGSIINHCFATTGWIALIAKGGIISIIYIVSAYCLGVFASNKKANESSLS